MEKKIVDEHYSPSTAAKIDWCGVAYPGEPAGKGL